MNEREKGGVLCRCLTVTQRKTMGKLLDVGISLNNGLSRIGKVKQWTALPTAVPFLNLDILHIADTPHLEPFP